MVNINVIGSTPLVGAKGTRIWRADTNGGGFAVYRFGEGIEPLFDADGARPQYVPDKSYYEHDARFVPQPGPLMRVRVYPDNTVVRIR